MKIFKAPAKIGLLKGNKGKDVIDLQEFLLRFGYLNFMQEVSDDSYAAVRDASCGIADEGIYDDATYDALRNYQKYYVLPVTGELDENTVEHMHKPRCGFPDIPTTSGVADFVAQGNRWTNTDITYRFDEFTTDLGQQEIRNAIITAFNLWSDVTILTFSEVVNAADIVIRFVTGVHGDTAPFDGVGNVLAHAFYPPPNSGDLAGDVHFDDAETWSVAIPVPLQTIDLITVAAHEIGHALGLAHSTIQGALMYPTYSGAHRFLSSDDISGIRSIYGADTDGADPGGGTGGCSIQRFSQMSSENLSKEIEVSQKFRDEKLLSFKEGQDFVELFNVHQDQIVKIMQSGDPKVENVLSEKGTYVLKGLVEAITSAETKEPTKKIDKKLVKDGLDILKVFSKKGDKELKKTINIVTKVFRNSIGKTVTEILEMVDKRKK